jgi:hypothetical protein
MGKNGTAPSEAPLTHEDISRTFDEGYREIEILPDGTLRETTYEVADENVTRSLKTERTWY